jgi:hypothetical protein
MTTQTIPNELTVTEAYQLIKSWVEANAARLTPNKMLPIGKLSTGEQVYLCRTTKDELRARVSGSLEMKYVGKWGKDYNRVSGGGKWHIDELQTKNNLRVLLTGAK